MDYVPLRNANHFASSFGNPTGRCALYLEDVYILRSRVEGALLELAGDYLARGGSAGRWLSIAGDAGHGKTSLLWYLTQPSSVT
jgi:hypothetical protein